MDDVARSSASDREALFSLTAERMGVASTVILEKDFWVCWLLSKLFALEGMPRLLFKGGTSLSKGFNLIARFSEDIDISLSREDLGFGGEQDPVRIKGRNERSRRIKALGEVCASVVRSRLHPALCSAIDSVVGRDTATLTPVDLPDGQIDLEFHYPRAFDQGTYGTYVKPSVRVEIGARSDHEPKEPIRIRSYAAEHVPEAFSTSDAEVIALSPERTFWEKATIFHSENNRPVLDSGTPAQWARLSRHAYDLFELDRKGVAAEAIAKLDLLRAVVQHKDAFFHSGWARYAEARPGTFRLAPSQQFEAALRKDYDGMRSMFFETSPPPSFDDLLAALLDIERRIHAAGA